MPPKKTATTTGTKKGFMATTGSDAKEKAACEKRGGTYYPATATQGAVCIVIPKEPNFTIQIDRFRGEPCEGPVGPRDPYILVPPTRELALALINAIKR